MCCVCEGGFCDDLGQHCNLLGAGRRHIATVGLCGGFPLRKGDAESDGGNSD